MSGYDDRLKDYVDVKERIRLFYERYPDGRLVTSKVRVRTDADGVSRVWVRALAYRTPDDPLPGPGWSWMVLPGTTPYTRGSELENTETSAWGRAIGSLGIGIDKSVASADEVRAKEGEDERASVPRVARGQAVQLNGEGLVGSVEIRQEWLGDLEVRQTPEGPITGFRLKVGRQSQKVQARGPLAVALGGLGTDIIGKTVTCWGTLVGEEFTPKGAPRPVAYQVLRLERIHGPTFDIPAVHTADVPDEPPEPSTEPTEASSLPLFDADEQAALDEAVENAPRTAA